jgi:hypothetical protein
MWAVKIKEQHWLARLAAARLKSPKVAMVFGNTIHLWGLSRDAFLHQNTWVNHELMHVLQYQQMGKCRFLWYYLLWSLRKGYWDNPIEIQARAAEQKDWLQLLFEIK